MKESKRSRRAVCFAAVFLIVNLTAVFVVGIRESADIDRRMSERVEETGKKFGEVMDNYEHSFRLFVELMLNEIGSHPDPDEIWDFLKTMDQRLLDIEGETFDGLYMYYRGRYLYSWDTPYSQYEETGYVATERPWYKDAVAGDGKIVFTPPYMSYANHYILTALSQLQPDKETVFAYDIKMGDIQQLVSSLERYDGEQIFICDKNGTIIGSTKDAYLGGSFYHSVEEIEKIVSDAQAEVEAADPEDEGQVSKAEDQVRSASAFLQLRQTAGEEFERLIQEKEDSGTVSVTLEGSRHYGTVIEKGGYRFLAFVPVWSMLKASLESWLVPLLIIELFLIYVLSRISRELKNRELRRAYVELGQTQRRLEIALSAAKKAAAIDDLTGMMNFRSFRTELTKMLEDMGDEERGILIMLDGDHFKQINDTYGHNVGDEVIKLSAQMIIGRIRTIDLASRLHGDEFAIFVANTSDYSVAERIVNDINKSMEKEAEKRKMPSITLSAGAVIAKHGDLYTVLAKTADEALYRAKETHDGGFAY